MVGGWGFWGWRRWRSVERGPHFREIEDVADDAIHVDQMILHHIYDVGVCFRKPYPLKGIEYVVYVFAPECGPVSARVYFQHSGGAAAPHKVTDGVSFTYNSGYAMGLIAPYKDGLHGSLFFGTPIL